MKPPPEEKLLKLIRGKGASPRPIAAGAAEDAAPAGGAAAAIRPPLGSSGRARRLPSLRTAIGLLGVVLGVELVILLVQALRPLPAVTVTMPAVMAFPAGGATPAVAPAEPEAPEIPSLAAAASRPLFAPPAASAAAEPSKPSGSAAQLASRLTLMGIVAGHPAQAIIEDSTTQKTYFVTEGQMVVDGAVLEQVLDNRVVLNLAGERVELGL
ncbi:MAG: hypothetical protein HYT90_03080 [Candidatus Omnitrophica bacterium]|nr:hypothetical protein [Candidatus Omnitrophota bacterium]